MAEAESLKHIDNTSLEKILKKIKQFDREEETQRQKLNEALERGKAANQLTDAFLDFSRKLLSTSRETIAKLKPEECQVLWVLPTHILWKMA